MQIERSLDLELGWRKTKRDYNHYMNSFVSTPYIPDILDANREDWLEKLGMMLNNGEYEPNTQRIVEVPKTGFHLRPASAIYVEDHVLYSSLLLEVYDDIRSAINWSANSKRFSHILLEDKSSSNEWQAFEREPWKAMQDAKIEKAEEHEYVLITDIAGFYENIEIPTAVSTINQMGADDEIVYSLKDLLQIWAEPRNRGVPQGFGSSDILAEAYLNSIDRRLTDEGITHVRYTDDFIIFTNTFDDAIWAQNLLERLLRERGLNMKSGKTNIQDSDTALNWFREPERSFEDIRGRLESVTDGRDVPVASMSPTAESYGNGREGSRRQTDEEEEMDDDSIDASYSTEVLEESFDEYVEDVDFSDLNPHLFRFIINRLGNVDSNIAVDYCFQYIIDGRPDVRRILYDYFQDLSSNLEIANRMADVIAENDLKYPYHEFVIIRWYFDNEFQSPEILQAARTILRNRNHILEARDYSVALLARYGEFSDLELIESQYSPELRTMSKAVFAYALRHLEPMRRGSFYERMDSSHHIVDYSIEAGKADS